MDSARAFWTTAAGRGEIRDEVLPAPSADDVVVRTEFSAISRGTELLVFDGRVPASEYMRMRAPFQAGDFPAPVKYGYSCVGRVESGPAPLRERHVFVLFPHQTRFVVPADAVHLLPDGLPPERAVLAANMETAINGMWDAAPRVGDRIAVVGGGVVGCLAAWLAGRMPGSDVELVDIDPQRASIAKAIGARFAMPPAARRDGDVVIHASGSAEGLRTALDLAGVESLILELSWYGTTEVPLPLGGGFHSRRLTIKSSQVGTVSPAQQPRWTRKRRMALALQLLRGAPELDALISGESAFDDLPAVMADLATRRNGVLCQRIRYST